jgi:hypothetical protein
MPTTMLDSEFFEQVMAKSQQTQEGYRIKDPPKEYGLDFWQFLKVVGQALVVSYVIYSLLSIFL